MGRSVCGRPVAGQAGHGHPPAGQAGRIARAGMWASSMRAVPCGPSSSRQRAILQAGQAIHPAGSGPAPGGPFSMGRPWAVLQARPASGPSSRRQRAGHRPGRPSWHVGRHPAGSGPAWAAGSGPAILRQACYDLTILCQVDIMTLISQLVVMYHADIASVFAMAGFYQVFGGPIRAARGTYARARATRQGRPSSDLIVV